MAKKKVKSKGRSGAKPLTPSVSDAIADAINSEVIAAAYNSANQPLLVKLCRLCESKDGPFLNIFDADKITAKKIEELMPFGIAENDDLPHKICFRCSAKVEELHEFIQKCIKTQENLKKALGSTKPPAAKTKTRALWEEKLTKSNISNDDICDALIKKAMEGIKDIPLKPLPLEEEKPVHIAPFKRNTRTNIEPPKKEVKTDVQVNNSSDLEASQTSQDIESDEIPLKARKTRSNKTDAVSLNSNSANPSPSISANSSIRNSTNLAPSNSANLNTVTRISTGSNYKNSNEKKNSNEDKTANTKRKSNILINKLSFDDDDPVDVVSDKESDEDEPVKVEEPKKPFNIMDHVSMIKVTGVGILFQCKLCNRNFVKKEVVESHNCAKNGIPKTDFTKSIPTPELPKAPTVKYIKMDTNMKRTLAEKSSKPESNQGVDDSKTIEPIKPMPDPKPKPKIGPASKVRKLNDSNSETSQAASNSNSQESNAANSDAPSVIMPSLPSLNGRYKLVPGPNNTFTLIEEKATSNEEPAPEEKKVARKRKLADETIKTTEVNPNQITKNKSKDEEPGGHKPYPVGLFQTVPHHSRIYNPPEPEPVAFTTPAMKKQSYTVVQTGNPSKLLISTKPQPTVEEVPKKRSKKLKPQEKSATASKEPFTVTLEDVAPPKDSGFFTFINVDPLLQPSYVLPTDNIIQESQISTSTSTVNKAIENKEKEKYSCNMCGETFSREKKLLTHIQSHYTKMDEEDQMRAEKTTKKRGKKQ